MRQISFRIIIALITLSIGIFAVCLWFYKSTLPVSTKIEKSNDQQTQITPNKATQDRNLLLYDFGGHQYSCEQILVSKMTNCEIKLKEARKFIWEHWQEKRRGYIIISFASTDSMHDAHIFIEPNESGEWHIVWRSETILQIGEERGMIIELPDIHFLGFKSAGKNEYPHELETNHLIFSGKHGEVTDF